MGIYEIEMPGECVHLNGNSAQCIHMILETGEIGHDNDAVVY